MVATLTSEEQLVPPATYKTTRRRCGCGDVRYGAGAVCKHQRQKAYSVERGGDPRANAHECQYIEDVSGLELGNACLWCGAAPD